jgi:hypothetical protein
VTNRRKEPLEGGVIFPKGGSGHASDESKFKPQHERWIEKSG